MVISADNLLYADEVLIMGANFKSYFSPIKCFDGCSL